MNARTLVLILAVLSLASCAGSPRQGPVLAATQSAGDVAAGQKLYAQHCASCHAADARGGRGPSLRTVPVQSMADADLAQFLADGNLRKGMPSWSQLTLERRMQLTQFVKSFTRKSDPP
jgi:mono/diheme cytochrome c family protein